MIIGRTKEKKQLSKILSSSEAEFVVLYGRRRIGKTYLIREFFTTQPCEFLYVTGSSEGTLKTQLIHFTEALAKTFFANAPLKVPASWHEAFQLLHQQIISTKNKVVIFLDELPWLATPKSGLLQVMDYYWNHHWSTLKNVILIGCGSSASWMMQNIIYHKGGLHNRVTAEICLLPFTLAETQAYLTYRKIHLKEQTILNLYLALGGVPYYLKYVEKGLTAEQNIQQIIFNDSAPLKDEFNKLFKSLFKDAKVYIELIHLLAKKAQGLSRVELAKLAKHSQNGGRLTDKLKDLCAGGFIQAYIPWGKQKGEYYKVVDEFCLFFLTWVESNKKKGFLPHHWINQAQSQPYKIWAGYAFEMICFKHIKQIVKALGIECGGKIDTWRTNQKADKGAQIDLLIDRNDNAISICEIKYTAKPFKIDKQYAHCLQNKVAIFKETTGTQKQLFIVLITANGVQPNEHSAELLSGIVTLTDLFKEV